MKTILYKQITIEGYRSFGSPVTVVLDRPGINLVKGSNGHGKSTMFDAILWAEFGAKPKATIETWKDRRPTGYRGTRVVIERTDGQFDYMVARHLNFKGTTNGLEAGSKLMVFKKPIEVVSWSADHLIPDHLYKADLQLAINEQIGLDYKAYTSSVIFGQRVASLVKAGNAQKRELFEQLFDLEFVAPALEKAKTKLSDLTLQITQTIEKGKGLEVKIETDRNQLAKYLELIEGFEKTKAERVEQAQANLDAAKVTLAKCAQAIELAQAELEAEQTEVAQLAKSVESADTGKLAEAKLAEGAALSALQSAQSHRKSLKQRLDDALQEGNKAQQNLNRYNRELADIKCDCPTCNRPLEADKIEAAKETIKAAIKREEEVIANMVATSDKLSSELQEFDNLDDLAEDHRKAIELVNQINASLATYHEDKANLAAAKAAEVRLQRDLETAQERFNQQTSQVQRYQSHLTNEQTAQAPNFDIESLEKAIEESKVTLSELDTKIPTMQKRLTALNWWVKKGFAAGGLKAFVFNAMLKTLNAYAAKYASRLGFSVQFSVDLTKESKPFYTKVFNGEQERDYDDLSGGQQQRVDLCLSFAMHDLISQNKANINIFVTDEGFEGLDNEGVEAAFELLRVKAQGKSVYVVTHSAIIDTLNCQNIWITSDNIGNTIIDA